MYRMLNVIPPLAILLGVYMAYQRNLFQTGLLLGRSFFSLILALALFGPIRSYLATLMRFSEPYGNATAFFVIWLGVTVGFEKGVIRMLEVKAKNMKFEYETPGRLAGGALAGLLVSMALMAGAVLLPEIEGGFMEAGIRPVGEIPRRTGSLYSAVTLTGSGTLSVPRMEAGHYWARAQIQSCLQQNDPASARFYVSRFREHYDGMLAAPEKRKQRLQELSDMVSQ